MLQLWRSHAYHHPCWRRHVCQCMSNGAADSVMRVPRLVVQNTVKALQRARISLDGKELAFDAMPLATQLFLGNISRCSCSIAVLLHCICKPAWWCSIEYCDKMMWSRMCFVRPCSEWGSGVDAMRADLAQFGTVERAFIVHNAEGQSKVSSVSADAVGVQSAAGSSIGLSIIQYLR